MKFTFISFNMEHKALKVHTLPLATAADTALVPVLTLQANGLGKVGEE